MSWAWSEQGRILFFFLVVVRVTALAFFLPVFGDRSIPVSIKILFGLAISVVVFPGVWGVSRQLSLASFDSVGSLIYTICLEIGFGVAVGFASRWIFDAVQFAGHFAGTALGFSMASVLDPHTETQTIALAEPQYVMAVLLFLGLDGHHIYLDGIAKSLELVPPGTLSAHAWSSDLLPYLIRLSAEVLNLGVRLAAPVLAVAVLVNLSFGIMARAVPQMNVMAVSFTANIVLGLAVVLISLPGFMNLVGGAFDAQGAELLRFLRMFGG